MMSARWVRVGTVAARRSYGTGSLYVRTDKNGRETWYGHWRTDGAQLKRRIGPKRAEGIARRADAHAGRGQSSGS